MTMVIFTVFAGKMCSTVSPLRLPHDFYANFGGDPFTGLTHRMTASCGQCFSIWNDCMASFFAAMALRSVSA